MACAVRQPLVGYRIYWRKCKSHLSKDDEPVARVSISYGIKDAGNRELFLRAIAIPLLKEMSVNAAGSKILIVQNALVQRDCGLNSFNNRHIKRAFHPVDGFLPIPAVGDYFGD